MGQNEPTASQRKLRERLIEKWPEHGSTDGFLIPPVRKGGRTERLIDLAVELAEEIYGAEIRKVLQEQEDRDWNAHAEARLNEEL